MIYVQCKKCKYESMFLAKIEDCSNCNANKNSSKTINIEWKGGKWKWESKKENNANTALKN